MKNISENIRHIRESIQAVSGTKNIELIAVSKTFPYQDISEALKCGIKHIGESKIQEALPKFDHLNGELEGIKKHFIGHLQSNKAKKAVEHFDLIHSIDSLHLAKDINKHASTFHKIQECLIEVKVSNELTKTGIAPENANDFYMQIQEFSNILIRGLMIITPLTETVEDSRPYFRQGYELFEKMKNKNFNILSMGMSGDFKTAIEEGSNMVRIGTAIFGERDYGNS
ncbi:MAG: YggS family pyridoxal phosphate-dependent enzyme [Elusimicrobiota bacterium]|jgi:pyridoxal phosphate enzyme (YggS family)|nr:YggS family pyridoxal phosphate-dependent enzyme [Elusimicrobiota bacterium]